MDIIENYPQGYWQSGNNKFINKYQSLLHATKNNLPFPSYIFFNSVWENFDRSLIGTVSLKDLYRQRAMQLREKYDYLILYFSGGADSYNVLRSFIDNGIKLDEICVKWCNDTLAANTKIYTPNTKDNTAWNYLSEWDYAIKPVLDEISKTHPEIKIEIVDWFKNKKLIGAEETFAKVNHFHEVEITSLAVWSPNEEKMIERGKTVGSIYGIDKPTVYFKDNDVANLFFYDSAVSMGTPNPVNIFGTEYFYYAYEMPLLTFEMAHCAYKAFNSDIELNKVRYRSETINNPLSRMITYQQQQKRLRPYLYSKWPGRFQTYKSTIANRSDKHFWIYESLELKSYKDSYQDMIKMHAKSLSKKFYHIKDESIGYWRIPTKGFPLFHKDPR